MLCPLLGGRGPRPATCESIVAYKFNRGQISDVDVSGCSIAMACLIPGNVLAGGWKAAVFIDERATDQQMQALLDVYTGELGGPLADVA